MIGEMIALVMRDASHLHADELPAIARTRKRRSAGGESIATTAWKRSPTFDKEVSGDHSGGETPVPIPNTAVKPASADGTALATGWESRSSPGISFFFARQG